MFSKKLSKADYSSVGNIFTFCCGFFVRSNGVRRNSEEIAQENPDEKSAINGTTNAINPEQKAETEEAPGENAKRKKSRKKAKTQIGESGKLFVFLWLLSFGMCPKHRECCRKIKLMSELK